MRMTKMAGYRAEKVAIAYFLFAMLWILTSDHLLGLLVSDPALLISIGTYKGILFVSTTALLLYLILRVWVLKPASPLKKQTDGRRGLLLVFSGMTLLVPLLSLSLIQIATPQAIQSAQANIQMIARMKADYLDQWFTERARLANMIAMDHSLISWVDAWSESDNRVEALIQLTAYLNRLQANDHFDGIYLYHIERDQGLSSGEFLYEPSDLQHFVDESKVYVDPFFAGVHALSQSLSVSWVVPIYTSNTDNDPTAIVILSIDPATHLYANLGQWPVDSYSAELFLLDNSLASEPKLLSPRKSIDTPLYSTVEHVDTQSLGNSTDAVIGSVQPLSQVNWSIAALQSRQEVLAPIYMMATWLGLLSFATVLSVMFALRLVWQQNRRLQKASFQLQSAEKDRLLLKFFEMPFVGMAITDPNTGQWLQFNPELCRLLGYSEIELKTLSWQDVTHTDDLEFDLSAFNRLKEGHVERYTLEKRFIRKDQSCFSALLNVGAVRLPNGQLQYCIATVADITERKRYESELLHQRDLYNSLSETNQAIIRCKSQSEIYYEVCRIAVVYGKMRFASIVDINNDEMHLAESYGQQPASFPLNIVKQSQAIGSDAMLSQVYESGQPNIVNDLNGLSSQACLPVRHDEQVIALLVLYADDADFFNAEIVSTLSEMADDIAFALRFIQQEDALRAAVQVVEASPVVLFRWLNQPGWPVTYVSANVGRWGYEASQFLSGEIDYKQLVHSDDRDWLEEEVAIFMSQKRDHYHQEYRIQTLDGQELWVEDITKVTYNPLGVVEMIEGVVTDVTSRKTVQQRIEFLSRHDSLTGLPNRPDVLTSIEIRGGDNTALLMLDLDRFKDVNDSFGHRIGDQLLCSVAELLKKVCPADALLARFGGDEFALLIDRDKQALKQLANDCIEALRTPIQLPDGMEIRIGACVGVACFKEANNNAEELLRQADAALYKAKDAGREQVCFYTDALTQAALVRLNTESRLRHAIKAGHLSVFFQPQIDIASGELMGAEALIRWRDGLEYIPPDQFIPIAEQSGLIHPIGEWVMDQVCLIGRQWLDKGYAPLTLAVNLSSFQLRHGNVVSMIRNKLHAHQYPATGLEVELTESALMRREDEAEKIFDALHKMGVSLAIDDFGTGYSSLSYLKNFQLDVLKIDKSFINDLETSADDREIAAAIIVMAQTLGLKVLAEGVETEAQLAQLKALGCDFYQGYYKSPAVSSDEFERFLQQQVVSPQGLEPRSGP